jgi:hypothetical protein
LGRSGRLSEKLLRYDLIVIDELGYLPFSQSGGQLLFHLISKLYENTSLGQGNDVLLAADLGEAAVLDGHRAWRLSCLRPDNDATGRAARHLGISRARTGQRHNFNDRRRTIVAGLEDGAETIEDLR